MRNRNKGFTLVEIIISITIGSVVLALMGTMILTSSNFMSNTTNSDMDKRCVDSCMEFIRDQIEYSTDVRIIENKGLDNYPVEGEDNWHCFYIKNHILYRDDSPVFDKSFYNNKKLEILVKDDYKNNMRVDFTYHLNDNDGEKAYGNRDTVVFLNISEKNKPDGGLYVSSDVSLDSSKDNYAVYYKKSLKTNHSSDKPSGGNDYIKSGTVADRINLINYRNSRGYFDETRAYNKGDYVYYKGSWWYRTTTYNNNKNPDDNSEGFNGWIKLNKDYQIGTGVCYYKGDVVIYNGKYIQCQVEWGIQAVEAPQIDGYKWKEITKEEAFDYSKNLSNFYDFNSLCVNNKIPENISPSDVKRESIELYDSNKQYKIGDFVRVRANANDDYYYIYKKVFAGLGGTPGSSSLSGWQLLEADFDTKSSYVCGDVTIAKKGANITYSTNIVGRSFLVCKLDVITSESHQNYIENSKDSNNNDIYSLENTLRLSMENTRDASGWTAQWFFYEKTEQ